MGGEVGIAVELARLEQLAVVVGHQLADGDQLVPLLNEPGHHRLHGLHGGLIGAVEENNLPVQALQALDGVDDLLGVLAEPVLGVHGPGDDAAAGGVFHRLVHRAVGRPQQGGGLAGGGGDGLVRRVQVRQERVLLQLAEILVGVGVASNLAAEFRHPS